MPSAKHNLTIDTELLIKFFDFMKFERARSSCDAVSLLIN